MVILVGSSLFVLFGGTQAWAATKQTTNEAEASFTADLNRERTTRGLAALVTASDLVAYARKHSADMAAAGKPYHDPNIQSEVHNWQVMGDNVGTGPDEAHIHQGFMNSQTHRDEILEPRYTEVGVGCYWSGNVLYVTEVFRQPVSTTASSAPAAAPAPAPPPKVVTRTVTPAPAAPRRAPAPAAPAPAPAPAPTTAPTTAAPQPAPVADTSTTVAPQPPVDDSPDATVLAAKQTSSSPQAPTTLAIAAAATLLAIAGTLVVILRRRRAAAS